MNKKIINSPYKIDFSNTNILVSKQNSKRLNKFILGISFNSPATANNLTILIKKMILTKSININDIIDTLKSIHMLFNIINRVKNLFDRELLDCQNEIKELKKLQDDINNILNNPKNISLKSALSGLKELFKEIPSLIKDYEEKIIKLTFLLENDYLPLKNNIYAKITELSNSKKIFEISDNIQNYSVKLNKVKENFKE